MGKIAQRELALFIACRNCSAQGCIVHYITDLSPKLILGDLPHMRCYLGKIFAMNKIKSKKRSMFEVDFFMNHQVGVHSNE